MTHAPNPFFPPKKNISLKVINKHLMAIRFHPNAAWRIEANIFEAAKAHCIAHSAGKLAQFLPYSVGRSIIDSRLDESHPDLFAWYYSLSSDNPPGPVNFRSNPALFRELVEPLDFSKKHDRAVTDAIRARFTQKRTTPIEVDPDAIEAGDDE